MLLYSLTLLIIHECTFVYFFYSFSSQNDPTKMVSTRNEKFNQSSYFVRTLAYAIAHGWKFEESKILKMTTKVIKQSTYFCRVFGDCESLGELLREKYIKDIMGFFQRRPEDLDSIPEYFCEVFGFCDFLEKDNWILFFVW